MRIIGLLRQYWSVWCRYFHLHEWDTWHEYDIGGTAYDKHRSFRERRRRRVCKRCGMAQDRLVQK